MSHYSSLLLNIYDVRFAQTGDLDFALAHAVNMAEAGQTPQDKRTGTLLFVSFCSISTEYDQGILFAWKWSR